MTDESQSKHLLGNGRSFPAHDALLPGICGGLCPVSQMKLAEDIADISFDGMLADDQLLGDVGIFQTTSY